MRLLNTTTLRLESFQDATTTPAYAILSHTWGAEEITFQDLERLPTLPKHSLTRAHVLQSRGYYKVRKCCAQALEDGLKYAWIDTCCINKLSSAELSEAINSMFAWYKKAKTCYAYLEDVRMEEVEVAASVASYLRKARWFTRGWTLQELIAPREVVFFAKGWKVLGSKFDMAAALADVTGIDEAILLGANLETMSVARRMSWASERGTTRSEDMAYCLMGLFSVNMPLLYGEGEKAFIRLQEEIMKDSDDHSLFAWVPDDARFLGTLDLRTHFPNHRRIWTTWAEKSRTPNLDDVSGGVRGAFASHPREFSASWVLQPRPGFLSLAFDQPYALTNKGIEMQVPLLLLDPEKNLVLVVFNLAEIGERGSLIGIVTQARATPQMHLHRVSAYGLVRVQMEDLSMENSVTRVFLSKQPPLAERFRERYA